MRSAQKRRAQQHSRDARLHVTVLSPKMRMCTYLLSALLRACFRHFAFKSLLYSAERLAAGRTQPKQQEKEPKHKSKGPKQPKQTRKSRSTMRKQQRSRSNTWKPKQHLEAEATRKARKPNESMPSSPSWMRARLRKRSLSAWRWLQYQYSC